MTTSSERDQALERGGASSVVWSLTLAVSVVGANSLALSPVLGDVAASLGATTVAVAAAAVAYGGATAASALLFGRLIDRFGPGPSLVGGLLALALAMLGSAAAQGAAGLAAAQALAGAAAGSVLPASYALAVAVALPGREAETLGRVLTGWSISLVLGVPAFAAVASAASWRLGFLALALLAAGAGAALSRQRVPPAPPAAPARLADALRAPGVPALLAICLLFMMAFYGCYTYLGDAVRRGLSLDAGRAGLVVLAYGLGFGAAASADRVIGRVGADRLLPVVLAGLVLIYGAMVFAVGGLAAMAGLAAVWGSVNHFGLNLIVLLLTRAAPARRGTTLALNSAVSYAGELLGTGIGGQIYGRAGFGAVAAAGAACALMAALIAARRRPAPRAGGP